MNEPLTIVEQHKANFDNLAAAFRARNVALLECTLLSTGEKVAVIVATWTDAKGMVNCTPFAMFLNGNPFVLLQPSLDAEIGQE